MFTPPESSQILILVEIFSQKLHKNRNKNTEKFGIAKFTGSTFFTQFFKQLRHLGMNKF